MKRKNHFGDKKSYQFHFRIFCRWIIDRLHWGILMPCVDPKHQRTTSVVRKIKPPNHLTWWTFTEFRHQIYTNLFTSTQTKENSKKNCIFLHSNSLSATFVCAVFTVLRCIHSIAGFLTLFTKHTKSQLSKSSLVSALKLHEMLKFNSKSRYSE